MGSLASALGDVTIQRSRCDTYKVLHLLDDDDEPPQQAAWLMTPEHGRTVTFPVFCMDREAEGW